MDMKVSYRTYRYTLGGLFLIWGVLNLTDGYNLLDSAELNTMKGFIGILIMLIYILFEPRVKTY